MLWSRIWKLGKKCDSIIISMPWRSVYFGSKDSALWLIRREQRQLTITVGGTPCNRLWGGYLKKNSQLLLHPGSWIPGRDRDAWIPVGFTDCSLQVKPWQLRQLSFIMQHGLARVLTASHCASQLCLLGCGTGFLWRTKKSGKQARWYGHREFRISQCTPRQKQCCSHYDQDASGGQLTF